jgi:hypothetical protein
MALKKTNKTRVKPSIEVIYTPSTTEPKSDNRVKLPRSTTVVTDRETINPKHVKIVSAVISVILIALLII